MCVTNRVAVGLSPTKRGVFPIRPRGESGETSPPNAFTGISMATLLHHTEYPAPVSHDPCPYTRDTGKVALEALPHIVWSTTADGSNDYLNGQFAL